MQGFFFVQGDRNGVHSKAKLTVLATTVWPVTFALACARADHGIYRGEVQWKRKKRKTFDYFYIHNFYTHVV